MSSVFNININAICWGDYTIVDALLKYESNENFAVSWQRDVIIAYTSRLAEDSTDQFSSLQDVILDQLSDTSNELRSAYIHNYLQSWQELEDESPEVHEELESFCASIPILLLKRVNRPDTRVKFNVDASEIEDDTYKTFLPYGHTELFGSDVDELLDEHFEDIKLDYLNGKIPEPGDDMYGYFTYYRTKFRGETASPAPTPRHDKFAFSDSAQIAEVQGHFHRSIASLAVPEIRDAREPIVRGNNSVDSNISSLRQAVSEMPARVSESERIKQENVIRKSLKDRYNIVRETVRDMSSRRYLQAMEDINKGGLFQFIPKNHAYGIDRDYLLSTKPIDLEAGDDDCVSWGFGHVLMQISPRGVDHIYLEGGCATILDDHGHDIHPHLGSTSPGTFCWGNLHPNVVDAVSSDLQEYAGGISSRVEGNLQSIMSRILSKEKSTIDAYDDIEGLAKDLTCATVLNDWPRYVRYIWALLSSWDSENPYFHCTMEAFEERSELCDNYDYDEFISYQGFYKSARFYASMRDSGALETFPETFQQMIQNRYGIKVEANDENND